MKYIYILLMFVSFSVQIIAQEQQRTTDPKKLEELVVKEKRKKAKERGEFKRHAQTVQALTEDDLNRNNPAFVEQSLGTMAGVQVDKRTMLGGQRIVIRGYGNDQKFNNWGIKAYY